MAVSRHCYSSDISSIHKHSETGKWVVDDKTHGTAEYDHIIVATDPHAAAIILRNISPKLAQTIGQVEVTQSETILHTDESFMPSDSALWSPMNLKSTRTPGAQEQTQTECTAWINALQPISDKQQVFETWNPLSEPREGTVISRSMFDRPLVTMETAQMLHEVSAAQGVEGLWVCGAYTLSGVPLLENAADSGLRVAEKLAGVNRPWEHSLRRAVPSPVHALTAVSANLMRNAAQMTGNGISRAANWSRDCVREMSSIAFKTLPGWSDTPDTK
ncbi:hypothetical protein SARC_07809 [Sphaeroforma arctica JP610]|uniref:Amine oxidase domain-containing protein n=1 Tax=Sphaeroforma arctica JP610 TaxID=667725 RepID=A0A0L0FSQ2_9EUKA|nr:hypothetical protein SARC_07809 [Sphaeroforma arctica JP610]KNC79810.1 hypothetical protein SARC_07809 [Sphaeroforma arctica JP610]|eukprot:XP_014153712.1 hypothetical protein SARC_07809 [Sphaeroforma arctica JP610]